MNSSDVRQKFPKIGPGFVLAATGVGAGDLVAATVGGAKFGTVILWATVVGAILKFFLNEGIARWYLVNGSTMIQSWVSKFPKIVSAYFAIYLVIWSFIVSAALMASCGLAAHAFFPSLSVAQWGCIHSIIGIVLVLKGRYQLLEQLMKFFIGLMFITVLANLILVDINWGSIFTGLFIPTVPSGGTSLVLGIIGGVGGSVTLLCYSYWLNEKKWSGIKALKMARADLAVAYLLTGLFGVAIIILSAGLSPEIVNGNQIVILLAEELEQTTGAFGKWIFMIGFWGAVFSSLLGVWNGVPYLCQDVYASFQKTSNSPGSIPYNVSLLLLAILPMTLLYLEKPIWIVIMYAVTGALFMPFLAAMLLIMNNSRKWIGDMRNKLAHNIALLMGLVVFVYLMIDKIVELIS